jgi:hypothetical protein
MRIELSRSTIGGTVLLLATAIAGCAGSHREASTNVLTTAERKEGWRLLFDGKTTIGWRGYRTDRFPDGWQIIDGALVRVAEGAGDIITNERFRNFELALQWKVDSGGNSGIFYRGTEAGENTWNTAPEMQVLDDARHADGKSELTSAGALYGLYPAPRGIVRPAGEWNDARIVLHGNRGEHRLNGVKLFEFEIGSPDWKARVLASKFASMPGFARASEGYIGLQDHGDHVEFRNIRIRVLP